MAVPHDLPFTVEEYRTRIARVQKEMSARGVEVLMINHLENIYYLTGYRTIGCYSVMALFVEQSGDPMHLGRFIEKSSLQGSAWIDDLELYPDTEAYIDACTRIIRERKWENATIGVDKSAWYLTIDDFEKLQARLPNAWDPSGLPARRPIHWVGGPAMINVRVGHQPPTKGQLH